MRTLYILRGLPGSGKSTYARKLVEGREGVICSADDYFYDKDGNYNFRPQEIAKAHQSCRERCQKAMEQGTPIIVIDNTNTQLWEFEPYLRLAEGYNYHVRVVRINRPFHKCVEQNIHDCPRQVIKKMEARFENYPTEMSVENQ